MLALLLAAFIAALHAGILFGLADVLMLLRQWAPSGRGREAGRYSRRRRSDLRSIRSAPRGDRDLGRLFLEVGSPTLVRRQLVFRGTSHTTLGYGDLVLKKPWRSLGPISAINGLLTFGCSTAFLFLVLQNIWQHPL